MNAAQVEELLYQALETELGGVQVYEMAISCAVNEDLRKEEALTDAYEQVGEQEGMHLYHTMGWTRELWIEALGMPAVLPPPEEEKKVVTAIGQSRAEQSRDDML